MSNEMISVPRELLEVVTEFVSSQADAFPLINVPRGLRSEGLDQVTLELRALLAKPAERDALRTQLAKRDAQLSACIAALREAGDFRSAASIEALSASAEQPAPVAVVLPKRPYASEEDQQGMTEYEIGLGHGACEMWDEVKRLNPGARP